MANLIDTSYFVDEIEIANTNQEEVLASVTASIVQYEKEVLIDLLGYELYKELIAHTVIAGDKFDKLINGEEFSFSYNGKTVTRKWEGLKGFAKKSLIAYYVYYMHRKKHQSYNDGLSVEVEPDTENSSKASLYLHLVDVWNEFVFMYGDGWDDSHCNSDPSAYNYLLTKTTDFPTWEFKSQWGEVNRLGL